MNIEYTDTIVYASGSLRYIPVYQRVIVLRKKMWHNNQIQQNIIRLKIPLVNINSVHV